MSAEFSVCHDLYALFFNNNGFCWADLCTVFTIDAEIVVKYGRRINYLYSAFLFAYLNAFHTFNAGKIGCNRFCLAAYTKGLYLRLGAGIGTAFCPCLANGYIVRRDSLFFRAGRWGYF